MRMWGINPSYLCRKHLLGSHVELHMIRSSIEKGKSLKRYIQKRIIDPKHVYYWHHLIVKEMRYRGYKHNSEMAILSLQQYADQPNVEIDVTQSIKDLKERCADCRIRGS